MVMTANILSVLNSFRCACPHDREGGAGDMSSIECYSKLLGYNLVLTEKILIISR